jgi:hypothetical protein
MRPSAKLLLPNLLLQIRKEIAKALETLNLNKSLDSASALLKIKK